jgi:hypothetical protein
MPGHHRVRVSPRQQRQLRQLYPGRAQDLQAIVAEAPAALENVHTAR